MSGPSIWNFWSRHDSVVYGLRGTHPRTGRLARAYVGKTIQKPWTRRIEQHLFGGGRYNSTPQPWADTVPGWRPNGTVDEVIAAGGAYIIWRGRWSPMGLAMRESLAIWGLRPLYNYQGNRRNRRRIEKYKATTQRMERDQTRARVAAAAALSAVPSSPVPVTHRLAAVAAVLLAAVVLVPGGTTLVAGVTRWGWGNALGLVALLAGVVVACVVPKRIRAKRGGDSR